jgi:Domain of unknown function (DUF4352)
MKRLAIAAGALAASAALVSGCKSSDISTTPAQATPTTSSTTATSQSTAPSAAKAGVGSTIDLTGSSSSQTIQVTVVKVVDPDSATNEFESPPAGDHLVSVQFQILNDGTANYQDDPFVDISATDSAGQTMQQDIVTGTTAGAQLPSNLNLAPGDKSLGYETFDVPNGDSIAQVQYGLNAGFGGAVGQWQLK